MAFYCLYMLKIAIELALKVDPVYEDMASKFFEHFVLIADAMNALTEGRQGLWDAEDGFFYDVLAVNNHRVPLKVRSLVGLTPLFATGTLPSQIMKKLKGCEVLIATTPLQVFKANWIPQFFEANDLVFRTPKRSRPPDRSPRRTGPERSDWPLTPLPSRHSQQGKDRSMLFH